jgi:hypothetical protein
MKNCLIITFDLKNPGINQEKLTTSIKTNSWARVAENSFVVSTNKTAVEIRDVLTVMLLQGDRLYVGQLGNVAAWSGQGTDISNWLLANQK